MEKINYKEMEKLARKGLSYGEIADKLQVDLNVVVKYLEGLKIAKKKSNTNDGKKVPSDRREIVGELHKKEKMSVEEIAERLNIAKSLVIEDLLSLGINPFVQEQMGAANMDNASNGEMASTKGENGSTENEGVQEESVESIVERRRQIVRLMYKDEKTLEDIYKIFDGIPRAIIDKDIRYIKRNNIFMEEDVKPPRKGKNSSTLIEKVTEKQTKSRKKRISNKVKERREKVVKLIETMSPREIAKELGVSIQTINNDIKALRSQGLIPEKESKEDRQKRRQEEAERKKQERREERLAERRKRIAKLVGKMTQKEIAKELGVSITTINRDIKALGFRVIVQERREEAKRERQENISERRKRVAELIDKMPQEEIAKELGVSITTINNDIKALRTQGIIPEKESKEDREKKRKQEEADRRRQEKMAKRRKRVAELIGTMSPRKIAKKLGVSITTINNDIKALGFQVMIQERREEAKRERQEKIAKRRKKVAKLIDRIPQEEIAKKLGVSITTINNDISALRTQGMRLEKKKEEVVEKGEQGEDQEHKGKTPQIEPEEKNQSNGVTATEEATVMMANSEEAQAETENKGKVEGEADAKSTNNEGLKEDERPQEEKGEKIPERKEVQTNIHMLNKSNRRGNAESKYIAMMVRKIKELSGKGEIELAIKHLETLQNEINFSEKEERQFYEIMKILQKARIKRINKKYFKTDNGEIGTDER